MLTTLLPWYRYHAHFTDRRTEAERLGNVAKVTVTHKAVEKLAWAAGTMPAFWFCTGQNLLQGGMHPAASPAPHCNRASAGGTGQKSGAEVLGDTGARRILAQEAGGEEERAGARKANHCRARWLRGESR